jgi:hypothetical protein
VLCVCLSGVWTTAASGANGAWAAPVDLMSASGQSYAGVGLDSAFDGAGNAWAIWWESTDGTYYHAEVAELPAGKAAWTPATLLSDPAQDAETPRIAVDAQGDVLAVWVL